MTKTLLLADDSVTIQKVVGLSFASEDVTVVAVDNGDDAIARTREERPDVVLADVVMPGKNGYEVCEAIKADPALAHIPVLLLTGTFEAFDEALAESVGAAGHIAKPFEAQALVGEVRRLFDSPPPIPEAAPEISPAEAAEPQSNASIEDDAFDFFDEEPAADASPAVNVDGNSEANPELQGDSVFEFGSDESAPLDAPGDAVAPSEEAVAVIPDSPALADIVVTDADIEIEQASLTSAEALLSAPENAGDSLAPSASASADEPFDFTFEAASSESSGDTDPLEGIDPLEPVDADDLAQATVLDPRGASGYDVSSSDLGAATDFEPLLDEAPEASSPMSASSEPDATVLAPEFQTNEAAFPADATVDSDFFEAELVEPEPEAPEPIAPPSTEPNLDTVAVAMSEVPETAFAAEPVVEPEPFEQPRPLPPESAAQAESVLESIEPQLRQQLHDTLEKIAWESFSDLTDKIVQQSVERVEAIAWEVVPKLAEALIQEEIHRMKGDPPKSD